MGGGGVILRLQCACRSPEIFLESGSGGVFFSGQCQVMWQVQLQGVLLELSSLGKQHPQRISSVPLRVHFPGVVSEFLTSTVGEIPSASLGPALSDLCLFLSADSSVRFHLPPGAPVRGLSARMEPTV